MTNKLKGLTKKEIKAIEEFENLLINNFPNRLKKLILFGSKARGEDKPASDIDLLVVVSNNGKKITREIVTLTHQPIAKYMVDISPLSVEESFFIKWSPLLEKIKKEGIVLWTRKKARKNI